MNNIKVLFLKELMVIRNSYLKYIFILFFFPLSLYLLLSIPLSIIVDNIKPIYMIWSSVGIWHTTSLYLIYILNISFCLKIFNNGIIKAAPIQSYQYLLSMYLYCIFIGTIQLIVSIILVSSLNSDYLSFLNLFQIYIMTFPAFIIISSVSYLLTRAIKKDFSISISNVFVLLFISFGFGSFIPLSKFPESYYNIVQYFPISSTIINCQKIISNESIHFNLLFISFFYAIIFSLVSLLKIDKSMNSKK